MNTRRQYRIRHLYNGRFVTSTASDGSFDTLSSQSPLTFSTIGEVLAFCRKARIPMQSIKPDMLEIVAFEEVPAPRLVEVGVVE